MTSNVLSNVQTTYSNIEPNIEDSKLSLLEKNNSAI